MMPASALTGLGKGCRAPGHSLGRFTKARPIPYTERIIPYMKTNGNKKMPHENLPIYEKTCYGSGMKTDYEKAIEWLNKKAEKAGGITNLGKTVGAPASTFFRVLKGGSPPGADKLLDWISQLGGKIVFPDERMEGYTLIPKVVAQAGAGSSLITSDEVLGMYAFRDDFLRRVGVHAKESVMLDVIGHSMEPMIRHKDTILVDQSVKELRDGDIFLVGFGEELLVKRVQRTPRGWLLKSENRDFSDIVVEGPDLETFRVYGRVRWFGRVV